MDYDTYQALGLDKIDFEAEVNGRSNFEIIDAVDTPGDKAYAPCAEALRDDPPRGSVRTIRNWSDSAIFPDTLRDLWIYTPADFDRSQPAALLVFNDGEMYLDESGQVRTTRVLDSLIADGELPPTIGVFVNPGRPSDLVDTPEPPSAETPPDPRTMMQRSFEYDSLTDAYPRFLTDELLPAVASEAGATFTDDPTQRVMVGISSGGICAFNAAWHRPEAFGCVLSHCGSFTAIRGGHNYPVLVRANTRKPIRVFMQSGERDADILFGSWPLANRTMAASLEYAGYDVRFEFGAGGHSLAHGGAIFADSLRWLFRAR